MNDADYLAEAGIDADGNPVDGAAPSVSHETTGTQAPAAAAAPTIEEIIFEQAGKQYKVPANAEWSFKHANQTIKKPISTVINGYRQLGDYNARLAEVHKQRQEYEGRTKELDKFIQLQKWSEENPDVFEHVWNSYNQRDKLALQQQLGAAQDAQAANGNHPNAHLIDIISSLQQKLSGFENRFADLDKQKEEQEIQSDINLINNQMEEFQKYLDTNFQHANIKLENADEEGIKLSSRIIKFGLDNKLPDFEKAARLYLFDTLKGKEAEKARLDAVKNVRQQNRDGIIATSSTPFPNGQGDRVDRNVGNKSYESLASEAKRELNELLAQ